MISKEKILEVLEDVYDPEIAVDVVSMGLIYDVNIDDEKDVTLTMTLTTQACPYGPFLIEEIEQALKEIKPVIPANEVELFLKNY